MLQRDLFPFLSVQDYRYMEFVQCQSVIHNQTAPAGNESAEKTLISQSHNSKGIYRMCYHYLLFVKLQLASASLMLSQVLIQCRCDNARTKL
jgi:hypothetical protein